MTQTITCERMSSQTQFNKCITIGAAVLIGLLSCGCNTKDAAPPTVISRPVKVITVVENTNFGLVSLPGKIRASRRVELSFKVAGPLIELSVEEGQQIQIGQIIARIDPRDFETRVKEIQSSLSEARANLKSMERGARIEDIKILEAAVQANEAEYLFAEDQYKRYKQLWSTQHVSREDYDRQISQKNTAKARLASAEQDLAKGKKGARKEDLEAQESRIRGLEATLKAARDALDDTCLKAPFTGVVAKRHVENHQEIQAKQPIVFLQDISKLEVLVDVPETQAVRIREGYMPEVSARFASAPERAFPLNLKEFSTEADPQTLTYQAVLLMPRPKGINILPGMTATVEGRPESVQGKSSRIVIPAIAVTRDSEKQSYVWVLNEPEMTVEKNRVTIGEMTGSGGVLILDGLNPGVKVVTAGVSKLRDGMKVILWNASV